MIKSEDMNKKNYMYLYCVNCEEEGIYFTDDMAQDCFIKCNNCSKEIADVWCEDCGMGGPFVENLEKKPKSWKCPDCNGEYSLSDDFYSNPFILYRGNQVPKEIIEGIDKRFKKKKKGLFGLLKRK